jgi:hypothetical protein
MKLIGYLSKNKEITFATPVYSKLENEFFIHSIDANFNIIDFIKTEINTNSFKELYLSKTFELGGKCAIVFVGKNNYIQYNTAHYAIGETINYLNDVVSKRESKKILDEAILIRKAVFTDNFNIDNFTVKLNPNSDEITLTFDFPTPKKENSDDVNKSISRLEKTATSVISPAMQQLNIGNMNFELKLKLRAETRRNTLKSFNYQFKLNQNPKKNSN